MYTDLLNLLVGIVKRDRKILLHCFNGDIAVVEDFRRYFPNAFFSFTLKTDKFLEYQKRALRSIPLKRLMVETDSPYFDPKDMVGTPNNVIYVIGRIAEIRQENPHKIRIQNNENAKEIFNL